MLKFISYVIHIMDLQSLWLLMSNIGYVVRKSGCNGLEMWQPFKDFYSKYEVADFPGGVPLNESIKKLAQVIHYVNKDEKHDEVTITIASNVLHNSRDTDHFLIQHFRIPIMQKYTLPLVKILQIAYNVGQARAEIEKGTYSKAINNFYIENKLDDPSTYLDKAILAKGLVAKSMKAGTYKGRNTRYKIKYL